MRGEHEQSSGRTQGPSSREVRKLRPEPAEVRGRGPAPEGMAEAYRALVDNSVQGLMILQDGRVVFANHAAGEITGYAVVDMLVTPPEEVRRFVHPDDRDLVWRRHEQRLADEPVPQRYEIRGLRKDGTTCWLEIDACRIEYRGRPAIQVACVDITARKRSEQLMRTLCDSALDLVGLPVGADVFAFVAERVRKLIGEGIVSAHSLEGDTLTIRRVVGANGGVIQLAERLLKNRVVGMPIGGMHEEARAHLLTGKLTRVEGGLYELFLRTVPRPVCRALERAIRLEEAYSIGLRQSGQLFGNLTVLTTDRTELNVEAVETLVNQVSVALERRAAEQALSAGEGRLKRTIAGANDGIWEWPDLSRDLFWWSPRFFELLGYEPDAFVPTKDTFEQMLHPDDRARIAAEFKACQNADQPFASEYRLRHRSGGYRWFRARGRLFRDETGRPTCMAGSVRDITEEKEAQESLRESRRVLSNAEQLAHVGAWEYDLVTGRIVCSDEWCRIHGVRTSHFERAELETLAHPEDLPRIRTVLQASSEQGLPYEMEHRIIRQDTGEVRWVHAHGEVIRDHAGRPVRLCGAAQDITERREAERELSESRSFLETVLDFFPGNVAVLDERGVIVRTNDAWWAFGRENGLGTEFFREGVDYLEMCRHAEGSWSEGAVKVCDALEAILADRRQAFRMEYPCHSPDRQHWFDLQAQGFTHAGRRWVVVAHVDITTRKLAEVKRELALKILSVLNRANDRKQIVGDILRLIKAHGAFTAVAIRLKDDEDYPYFVQNGFPDHFVQKEISLCSWTAEGEPVRDGRGEVVLACLCGHVLQGRTDPSLPCYTEGGSFWTNSTSALLRERERDPALEGIRGLCCSEGYESVALVPLRSGDEVIGLLQVNDRRPNVFEEDLIQFYEGLGNSIGIAIARLNADEALTYLNHELARHKHIFDGVLASTTDHVYILDAEIRFLYVSESAARALGRSRDEIVGRCWRQLDMPVEIMVPFEQQVHRVLATGEPYTGEVCYPTAYGPRFIEYVLSPLESGDGERRLLLNVARDITERLGVEAALRESREQLQAIFEHSLNAIVVTDDQGYYRSANPAASKLLGYPVEQLLDMNVADLRTAGDYTAEQQYREYLEKGQAIGEFAFLRPDGQRRTCQFHAVHIREDFNLSILSDVTERKRAQEALSRALADTRKRAGELESLLIGARLVLEGGDFEETARRIFDAAREITGAQSGYVALLSDDGQNNDLLFLESGGLPCTVDPNLPMPIRGLREVAYRSGKPVCDNDFMHGPWVRFMPEGHVELRNVLFAPLNVAGTTVGVMGLANKPGDFTDDDLSMAEAFAQLTAIALHNTRNMESLRESEQRYRQVAELVSDYAYAFEVTPGNDLRLDWIVGRFEAICGYTPQEVEAQGGWAHLIHPDDLPLARERRERLLNGYSDIAEFRISSKDGDVRWLRDYGYPVWDERAGRVVRIYGGAQDITDRKQAELRLHAYRQRLQKLAAELALAEDRERRRIGMGLHDHVGQGLAMIKLSLQSAAEEAPDDLAHRIGDACGELDGLAESLRSLSFELSDSVLYEVGLPAAVEAYLDREVRERQGLTCTLTAPETLPSLDTELRSVLFRCFRELVANVLKHAEAENLHVRLRCDESRVYLAVEDDGCGFDRPDDDSGEAGVHFGLFSVRQQIEALGGRMTVRSRLGCGTYVAIETPIRFSHADKG